MFYFLFFFLMIRRPTRSTQGVSSAASDVYKRQTQSTWGTREEGKHSLLLFNSLMGLLFHSTVWILSLENIEELNNILLLAAVVLQSVVDSNLMNMGCIIIILIMILFIFLVYLFYVVIYYCYLCCCTGCKSPSSTAYQEKRMEIIAHLLDDVSFSYCRNINANSCTVCLADFKNGENVVILDCSERHVFHMDCIKSWLEKANVCPACRAPIIPQDIYEPVSYTHLTLPTILLVQISLVSVSLKKKTESKT
eukprot:TRINITY_DN24232_c0_g1_i4.p1 TRINITY_DN24232_c0_g1~~TRINITY_DN24232_c0_g1_i4.p1  ORF type:complete len:251 (+),score=37.83 TRINITY_DN24232_c0_g1_i4:44-796(+)